MSETLLLPYPPSVNSYYRNVMGQTLISKKGRSYRRAVMAVCGFRKPLEGRIDLKIDIYPPDRKRRDIDNILKSVLDALAHGGVYRDDAQVFHIDLLRCTVSKPGRLVIEVTEEAT